MISREQQRYDRVITEFSPDGRLSQVEYGMEASRRGSTIAATFSGKDRICLVIENGSFGKIHRIDHHVWLATSGMSGDARVLASHLRQSCQQYRLNSGERPTIEQVAKMAGGFQHYLTRAGGIRPLGCSAIVLGIDPIPDEVAVSGAPRMFLADPGGVVEPCSDHCAIGKSCDVWTRELAPMLVDEDGEIHRSPAAIVERVLQRIEDPTTRVDVWIIKPSLERRGGMHSICHQNIDKASISTLGDGETS